MNSKWAGLKKMLWAATVALGAANAQTPTDIEPPESGSLAQQWDAYIASGRLTEARDLLTALPELSAVDAITSEECDLRDEALVEALANHPLSFSLHYMAMSCAQLRGDQARADEHETQLGAIAELMTADREGTHDSPWRMGLFTDGAYLLQMTGLEIIDSFIGFRTDALTMHFIAYDPETGKQRDKLVFDAQPFFEAWKQHHIDRARREFGEVEAAWIEEQPWSVVAWDLAQDYQGPFTTTMGLLNSLPIEQRLASLLAALHLGSPIAATQLARLILEGEVPDSDAVDAIDLLLPAAETRYTGATLLLASMMERGIGTDPDPAGARKLVEQSQARTDAWDAEITMAVLSVTAGEPDLEHFETWLEGPLAAGEPRALALQARLDLFQDRPDEALERLRNLPYDADHDYREKVATDALRYRIGNRDVAMAILKDEADQGNASAAAHYADFLSEDDAPGVRKYLEMGHDSELSTWVAYNLGRHYEFGLDGDPDPEKALHWYRVAHDEGFAWASAKLALLLLEADDPALQSEGLLLLEKTARSGNGLAALNLFRHRVGESTWNGDPDDMDDYFPRLAEQGDPFARYALGVIQVYGSTVEQDIDKGIRHLKKAWGQGVKAAAEALAVAYDQTWFTGRKTGIRYQIIDPRALKDRGKWYERAVAAGSISAKAARGRALVNGRPTAEELQRGGQMLREAAAYGLPEARYWFGEAGLEKSPEESIKLLKQAANDGHRDSMRLLGRVYAEGKYVPADADEAAHWLSLAGLDGDRHALRELAEMFDVSGSYPYLPRAVFWLRVIAHGGDANAALRLGEIYQNGAGRVPADSEKALQMLSMAATANNRRAMTLLAQAYEQGAGVDIDLAEARAWYEAAAAAGDRHARSRLGWLMASGLGGPTDEKRGRKLVERAAKDGYVHAEYIRGQMYEQGIGYRASDSKALKYYRRAAEKGDPDGMIAYARFLREGIKTRADHAAARQWLQRAANAGRHDALELLEEMAVTEPNV